MKINVVRKFDYPAYMNVVYGNLYNNAHKCDIFDNDFICQIRTFFQYNKLVKELNAEISQGDNVCQFGATFGNQIADTITAIGYFGNYEIVDVNLAALERVKNKYGSQYQQFNFINDDVAFMPTNMAKDVVICFMLLSMVPLKHKQKIINNAIKMLKPGGKAVFIDLHRPKYITPFSWLFKMYNRLYHPFAETMQTNTIKFLAKSLPIAGCRWRQTSYFGGLFQKTVVTRSKNPDLI